MTRFLNGSGGLFVGDVRGGAGFVVGDFLQRVSPAEEGPLKLGDARLVFHPVGQISYATRYGFSARGRSAWKGMPARHEIRQDRRRDLQHW